MLQRWIFVQAFLYLVEQGFDLHLGLLLVRLEIMFGLAHGIIQTGQLLIIARHQLVLACQELLSSLQAQARNRYQTEIFGVRVVVARAYEVHSVADVAVHVYYRRKRKVLVLCNFLFQRGHHVIDHLLVRRFFLLVLSGQV